MARNVEINSRVEVEGLGHFLELEVVPREGDTTDYGITVARDVMGRLEVHDDQLVEGAYVDLFSHP